MGMGMEMVLEARGSGGDVPPERRPTRIAAP